MFVETKLNAQRAEELVGDHSHLVLGEPLRILIWKKVEEVAYANHIKDRVSQKLKTLVIRDFSPRICVGRMRESGAKESWILEMVVVLSFHLLCQIDLGCCCRSSLILWLLVHLEIIGPLLHVVVGTADELSDGAHSGVHEVIFSWSEESGTNKSLGNVGNGLVAELVGMFGFLLVAPQKLQTYRIPGATLYLLVSVKVTRRAIYLTGSNPPSECIPEA